MKRQTKQNRRKGKIGAADPVEELGREIGVLWRLDDGLEDRYIDIPKSPESSTLRAARDRVIERRYMLENHLPALKAKTLAGALVSVLNIVPRVGRIEVELDQDNGLDYGVVRQNLEEINSLLYSAMAVLRRECPGVFEACEGNVHMPDCLNPHFAHSNALVALIKTGGVPDSLEALQ